MADGGEIISSFWGYQYRLNYLIILGIPVPPELSHHSGDTSTA
jgi:hypothetical protein